MTDPYIESQFSKLSIESSRYTLQIIDEQGNKTHWLNITPTQLKAIKDILNTQEKQL